MKKQRDKTLYFRCTEEEKKQIVDFKEQAGYKKKSSNATMFCDLINANKQLKSKNKDLELELIKLKGEEKSNLRTEIMAGLICKKLDISLETIQKLQLKELRKYKSND